MPIVDLTDQEWSQAIALIAEGPWRIANPLLLRITPQLQAQQQTPREPAPIKPAPIKGNSGDAWGEAKRDQ